MLAHGFQLSLINTADALGPLADITQTSTVFPNGTGPSQPLHCANCNKDQNSIFAGAATAHTTEASGGWALHTTNLYAHHCFKGCLT